jgi:hypothetical protein
MIVGTIPLSMWGSGCSSQPLVQPDAGQSGGAPGSGGVSSGGAPGTGGVSSGGAPGTGGNQLRDASVDGLSPCCLQSEEGSSQCSPDGQELRYCHYWLTQGDTRQCAAPGYSYGYVWQVQTCPNGCVTVDAGVRGTGGVTGGPTGSGGNFGTGGNLASGGAFGSGGSSPTGGYPGTSAKCQ